MHRRISFEPLERREMLSVAPYVYDVSISSTLWDSSFIDELENEYLGYGGYSVSANSAPAPWDNIDQIKISFDQGVNVWESDLSVSGVNQTAYTFSDFDYDSINNVATWTLAAAVAKDKLFIDLDGDGLHAIQNIYGDKLDGDGNGTGGDDYELRFDVLPGDADQDAGVDNDDYWKIYNEEGAVPTDSNYSVFDDIDGDAVVEEADRYVAYNNDGDSLPYGGPAGESNDAPTTDGFLDLSLNEDSANSLIDLQPRFDDAEDADSALIYSVVSNSNSGLFDSVTINALDELVLEYKADANGTADIVVRATDTGGLLVETTLHVVVAAVNDAPVISNFSAVNTSGNYWTFTGTVTDVDDVVAGFLVDFGGPAPLVGKQAEVQADGTFSATFIILPSQYGVVTVQTEDEDGAESDLVTRTIG